MSLWLDTNIRNEDNNQEKAVKRLRENREKLYERILAGSDTALIGLVQTLQADEEELVRASERRNRLYRVLCGNERRVFGIEHKGRPVPTPEDEETTRAEFEAWQAGRDPQQERMRTLRKARIEELREASRKRTG